MEKICTKCKENKKYEEYQKDNSKKYGLASRCKKCCSEYRKGKILAITKKLRNRNYYINNKDKIKKRVENYYDRVGKGKEHKRIQILKSQLLIMLGGICNNCKRTDYLTLDHINNDGHAERYTSKWAIIRKIIKDEIKRKNYQLLCHNCNQKKQMLKIRSDALSKKPVGISKQCPTCDRSMDKIFFHNHPAYIDGKYYECSFCVTNRNLKVKASIFEYYGNACKMCNESDIDVLSLDHIEPIGKNRQFHGSIIYRKLLNGSYDRSKFQVLCFNCNQNKSGSAKKNEYFFHS